jgi:hypothetical protein
MARSVLFVCKGRSLPSNATFGDSASHRLLMAEGDTGIAYKGIQTTGIL